MARRSPDGESRLWFIAEADLTDPTEPAASEITSDGVDLTPYLREWDFPESGNTIDIADASSSFNKTAPGTFGGDTGTLTCYRGSEPGDDDAAWETLTRGTRGYFVERLFGGSDAPATAGDIVSVYEGTVISSALQRRARNEALTFVVSVSIEEEPLHNVEVDPAS